MFGVRTKYPNYCSKIFGLYCPRIRRNQSTTSPINSISPALLARARSISAEHAQLSKNLANEFDVTVARKVGELSNAAKALENWEVAHNSLSELHQLLKDPSTDTELHTLAAEEAKITTQSLDEIQNHLRASLIPAHPFAGLPCLVEIRPGAGGSEAALFAGDLLRMYQSFCKRHGLRYSFLKLDGALDREVQEAVFEVDQAGAYNLLRCEAGVHRVQRIPATETKGRKHTSAALVVVLPSFPNDGNEELGASSFDNPLSDYFVDPKDVRTDVMRAKGAGGQHVNTTDSAIRLVHIPTKTMVSVQDSRSQPQNREKAWRILRARLAQARREAREEEMAQLRVSLVGVAKMGRGDKIRTYNWRQNRVTDHRSGYTLNSLEDILEGGESLDKVMDSVKVWSRERDDETFFAEEAALAAKSVSNLK